MRSVFDDTGRFNPRYDDDDVLTLEADACVLAIGQKADLDFLKPEDGVATTPGGHHPRGRRRPSRPRRRAFSRGATRRSARAT